MRYDFDGGKTCRRIAQNSSEGGKCSVLGTIENHVSILRTKLKNTQK